MAKMKSIGTMDNMDLAAMKPRAPIKPTVLPMPNFEFEVDDYLKRINVDIEAVSKQPTSFTLGSLSAGDKLTMPAQKKPDLQALIRNQKE